MTRRHLLVSGRVHGVGYRWFVKELADSLGLSGWVRNREEGTVEAEAEGTPEALDKFEEALEHGNPSARVESIKSRDAAPQGGRGFEIRH